MRLAASSRKKRSFSPPFSGKKRGWIFNLTWHWPEWQRPSQVEGGRREGCDRSVSRRLPPHSERRGCLPEPPSSASRMGDLLNIKRVINSRKRFALRRSRRNRVNNNYLQLFVAKNYDYCLRTRAIRSRSRSHVLLLFFKININRRAIDTA